jgi:hypothetical protein
VDTILKFVVHQIEEDDFSADVVGENEKSLLLDGVPERRETAVNGTRRTN